MKKKILFIPLVLFILITSFYAMAENRANSLTEQAIEGSFAAKAQLPSEGWYFDIENQSWYFMEHGQVSVGWAEIEGDTYYFDPLSGAMFTGFHYIMPSNYYFHPSGRMARGFTIIDGTSYYFSFFGDKYGTGSWVFENGKWYAKINGNNYTDLSYDAGNWYYMDPENDGAMHTGWLPLSGNWYYLKASGAMVTGTYSIDGVEHNFDSSGNWLGYAN